MTSEHDGRARLVGCAGNPEANAYFAAD